MSKSNGEDPMSQSGGDGNALAGYTEWAERNIRRLVQGPKHADYPHAVLIFGQPGSGKGAITETVCRWFSDLGRCAGIDANELLYLHPDYARISAEDLAGATAKLRPLARRLAGEMLAAAMGARVNIVLESPSINPGRATEIVQQLKSAGYRATLIVLSVEPQVSWNRVVERQERYLEEFGFPRQCERSTHDAACRGLPAVLAALERQGQADDLYIISDDGKVLHTASSSAGYAPGSAQRALPEAFLTMPIGTNEPPASKSAAGEQAAARGPGLRKIVIGPPPETSGKPADDAVAGDVSDGAANSAITEESSAGPVGANPISVENIEDPIVRRRYEWQQQIRNKAGTAG